MNRKIVIAVLIVIIFIAACAKTDESLGKAQLMFVNKVTNKPIANTKIRMMSIFLCELSKDGKGCKVPILFQGTTDESGNVYIAENTLKSQERFYFSVEGYFNSQLVYRTKDDPFKHTIYYPGQTATDKWTPETFNIMKDAMVIKMEPIPSKKSFFA